MAFYRKKPVVIEAIQFTYTNIDEIEDFVGGDLGKNAQGDTVIATLEGAMICSLDDFIIKGVKGEFYPCKPDIFEKTYEKVITDIVEGQAEQEGVSTPITVLQEKMHGVLDRVESLAAGIQLPGIDSIHVSCLRDILPEIAKEITVALKESGYSELD